MRRITLTGDSLETFECVPGQDVVLHLVDGVPSPKIIDFGIAVGGTAGIGGDVDATSIERAGTAIYMSPEQLSPRARGR